MNRHVFLLVVLVFLSCGNPGHEGQTEALKLDRVLPSFFDNGDRIFLKIPTTGNDSISVYTDTGGGFTAIYQMP